MFSDARHSVSLTSAREDISIELHAGHDLAILEFAGSHTTTYLHSPGRVISPTQRRLPDNTQSSQQTSMHTAGFEPAISADERSQTHASDCTATGIA